MRSPNVINEPLAVVAVDQVGVTATVRRADPSNRLTGQPPADRTLNIGVGRADDLDDPRSGTTEQVVDVPVSGIVLAGRDPSVAIDPGERSGPERTPGVGVQPSREVAIAGRAERDRRRFGQFYH